MRQEETTVEAAFGCGRRVERMTKRTIVEEVASDRRLSNASKRPAGGREGRICSVEGTRACWGVTRARFYKVLKA